MDYPRWIFAGGLVSVRPPLPILCLNGALNGMPFAQRRRCLGARIKVHKCTEEFQVFCFDQCDVLHCCRGNTEKTIHRRLHMSAEQRSSRRGTQTYLLQRMRQGNVYTATIRWGSPALSKQGNGAGADAGGISVYRYHIFSMFEFLFSTASNGGLGPFFLLGKIGITRVLVSNRGRLTLGHFVFGCARHWPHPSSASHEAEIRRSAFSTRNTADVRGYSGPRGPMRDTVYTGWEP